MSEVVGVQDMRKMWVCRVVVLREAGSLDRDTKFAIAEQSIGCAK